MPPTGGVTPRRCDTPRTQFRKDICQKRLSYFKSLSQSDVNNKCNNQDKPVASSSSRTSSGSNIKNCRKKYQEIDSNVRSVRNDVDHSTSDGVKQCHQASTRGSNRHTSNSLASQLREVRANGGSKAGLSLALDNCDDCPGNHPLFQDDTWVTHAKQSDDTSQIYHTKELVQMDSDEVDFGLSTHRPSSSPLHQPTEATARLTLDERRNSRCNDRSTESSATPSYDRFSPADLESVLGAERYERLLNNFNESRETLPLWTDVQKSLQHIGDGDSETVQNPLRHMTDNDGETYRKNGGRRVINGIERYQEFSNDCEEDIAWFGRSLQIGKSTEKLEDVSSDEDLGLKTHRVDGRVSRNSQQDECSISQPSTKMQPKEGIRCSFSVNQIYAEADKLNNNYGTSKMAFGESQKPVHKVDYRHRVGTSLNVFESCFGKVGPEHNLLPWEGSKSQDPWQDRGYVEDNSVYETEDCAEKKPVKSSITARRCTDMVEPLYEMSQPDWNKMLPEKSLKDVAQSRGERNFQPSDRRLGHLQSVDACSEVLSSLQRYFSSLESLDKGSSQCIGFEPIPEPQIKDSPRRTIMKKKHNVPGSEVKGMGQKTTGSGSSVRTSFQRKGKKIGIAANRGKCARSSEKLTQQVSNESDDWDISDATSKSFAWSEQSTETVRTFDKLKQQKHQPTTGNMPRKKGEESKNRGEESMNKWEESRNEGVESRNKWEESRNQEEESKNRGEESRNKWEESRNKWEESRNELEESSRKWEESVNTGEESRDKGEESRNKWEESRNKVTGRMVSNADVGASRVTEDCFTDVSSLVASEDSSLQDWVTRRTEARSSNEDAAPSEHVKASTETVDHLRSNATDSRSIPVQHGSELMDKLKNATKSRGFDERNGSDMRLKDDHARYRNGWQEPFKCADVLVRMCPECSTQNREFETWCRQCRHILAHVVPTSALVKGARAVGASPQSTDANHRGDDRRTLAYCSMFTEDDESYTGKHQDGVSKDLHQYYRDDNQKTLPNRSCHMEDDESCAGKHCGGMESDHRDRVPEKLQLHWRDDNRRTLANHRSHLEDDESNARKHRGGMESDHQNGVSEDLQLHYRDDHRSLLPSGSMFTEDDERNARKHHGGIERDLLNGLFDDLDYHHRVSKHQDDVHKKELMANVNSDSAKVTEEFESFSDELDGDEDNVVASEQDGLASMINDRRGHIPNEGHQPDIPFHLRISLDSSVDSHRLDASGHQGAAWRNAARISEIGQFEYNEAASAGVDLPEETKQELTLDLRASGDSVVAGDGVKPGSVQKVPLNGSVARMAWSGDSVSNVRGSVVLQCDVGANRNLQNPSVDYLCVDHNLEEDQNGVNSGEKASSFNAGGNDEDEESLGESNDDDDVAFLDNEYRSFISRLIEDPQLQASTTKGVTIPQPKKSKGRPKTTSHTRPEKPRSSVSQKSLSKPSFKQKWASSRSSTSASFSYDDFARCLAPSVSSKKRPSSAKMFTTRGLSVSKSRNEENGDKSLRHSQIASARASGREKSKSTGSKSRSVFKSCPSTTLQLVTESDSHSKSGDMLTVHAAPVVKGCPSKSLFAAVDPYALYIAMSPRIEAGDMSVWLCLPDEILLFILSFLTLSDLAKCARTCRQFRRVAADSSLWRNICLKKRNDIYDDWLIEIGKKKPRHLILDHCHGDHVTANGLRELFRDCADSLQEFSFAGCSRGQLTGDNILLHAASRCRNITHLDASWCNINDNGVLAISDTAHQLHSLCLNGCQALSDDAVHTVVVKHGIYLRRLELFGCFNITSRSMASITNNCKGLVTLSLGQCWKVTDISISQLSASLGMVQHLDIRGCKQIRDLCIHHIMKNCPHLVTFSVANCPNITDGTLAEIATYATQIRSLDVCGCHNITDVGVKAVAICCQKLEVLDISSTKATHRSVSVLATSCTGHIQVLKINFCKNITSACLIRLVRSCTRLTKLFLYGLNGLRNWDELRITNPQLAIEM